MTKHFLILFILVVSFELKSQDGYIAASLPDHPMVIGVQDDNTFVPLEDLKPLDYDHLFVISPGSSMASTLYGSNGHKNGVMIFSGNKFKGETSPFFNLIEDLNLTSHPMRKDDKTPFTAFIKTILELSFQSVNIEMDEKTYSLQSPASLSNIEPEWMEELEVSTVYKKKSIYYELRLSIFESFKDELTSLNILRTK